ncbi:MAG: hypothetical protein ACJAS4_000024 [Bacteriovoracaceae bacterium]|jgi:uncharacterized protein RhaS with RHS repeats
MNSIDLFGKIQRDDYREMNYNPKSGRFISEDPIGFQGGDGNLYRYVNNNSINYTDPTGLLVVYAGFGGAAGIGAGQDTGTGFNTVSGGFYLGSNKCSNYSSTGNYGQIGTGDIAGGAVGAGYTVGFNTGDVSDFNGEGSALGIVIGGFNLEVTFGANGGFSGGSVGFGGKGAGVGTYGYGSNTGLVGGSGTVGHGSGICPNQCK